MTDRQDAINALEKWVKNHKGETLPLAYSAVVDTLELLKEQEAVPVIQREIMHMLFWCCGSCGVAITDGDKFCRNCGKKVKWHD